MTDSKTPFDIELEWRRVTAAHTLEHHLSVVWAGAAAHLEGQPPPEEFALLGRTIEQMRRPDLEDAYSMLLEIVVTKQWLLHPLRVDCPCESCAQSRETGT